MTISFSHTRTSARAPRMLAKLVSFLTETSMKAAFSVFSCCPPNRPATPTMANIASTIAIAPCIRVRMVKRRIQPLMFMAVSEQGSRKRRRRTQPLGMLSAARPFNQSRNTAKTVHNCRKRLVACVAGQAQLAQPGQFAAGFEQQRRRLEAELGAQRVDEGRRQHVAERSQQPLAAAHALLDIDRLRRAPDPGPRCGAAGRG